MASSESTRTTERPQERDRRTDAERQRLPMGGRKKPEPKPKRGTANPVLELELSAGEQVTGRARPSRITRGAKADLERTWEMFDLRACGLSYREIGERIGLSASQVFRIMDSFLKHIEIEAAETYRIVAIERLHTLMAVEMDAALDRDASGHYSALDRVLAIQDRVLKLFGLDQPQQLLRLADTADVVPAGQPQLVLGLNRDEYIAALRAVKAKQNRDIYDDPDDRPDDIEIADAETVAERPICQQAASLNRP